MRRKFNPKAVASSTGDYTRVSHDRKAGTTGRRVKKTLVKCGQRAFAVTTMQAAMLAPLQRIMKL